MIFILTRVKLTKENDKLKVQRLFDVSYKKTLLASKKNIIS